MKHHLLGFDIRYNFTETTLEWPPSRRTVFLLRSDIGWPMSVDTSVWPSLFKFAEGSSLVTRAGIEAKAESVVQDSLSLWDDVESMDRTASNSAGMRRSGVHIAVELLYDRELAGDVEWDFLATEVPAVSNIPVDWAFAGYDVADRYLVSGLSNCSYSDRERLALAEWAIKLNEYGLFADLEDACRFKGETEKRVPDHQPFFVYGIRGDIHVCRG